MAASHGAPITTESQMLFIDQVCLLRHAAPRKNRSNA